MYVTLTKFKVTFVKRKKKLKMFGHPAISGKYFVFHNYLNLTCNLKYKNTNYRRK